MPSEFDKTGLWVYCDLFHFIIYNNNIFYFRYTKKIKEASRKYHDQPQTPLERAVFWTEYVLRHQGADDLSLPGRDMYFFQTSNMDVVLFLSISILTIIYILVKCFHMICYPSKSQKEKTQ